MKLHKDITPEALMTAVESQTFGLENPGFCNACGAEHDGLEPDARKRKCDSCGANEVYGAEELMIQTGGGL